MRPYQNSTPPFGERGIPIQYYNQPQPQPQHHHPQLQPQQHQFYDPQTQYHGIISPNGVTALPPQPVQYYAAPSVLPASTYYTQPSHLQQPLQQQQQQQHHHHHHHQHHRHQQQRQAPGIGHGSIPRGGGVAHTPGTNDVGFASGHQFYHRENYRGGRGRGGHGATAGTSGPSSAGGGFRSGHNGGGVAWESYFAVHLKDFDTLEEAGRRGSICESLVITGLTHMKRRASNGTLKILVLIERKYLAACMSVPPSADDIILSRDVAVEFLDVQHVYCDDGLRLVDVEDGTHVAKHVYATLRTALTQLTAYDKPQPEMTVDINNCTPTQLLEDILSSRAVFSALASALTNDNNGTQTELWRNLLLQASAPTPTGDGTENTQQTPQSPEEQAKTTGKLTTAAFRPSCGIVLLATAQGTRLFRLASLHPQRRKELFDIFSGLASQSVDPAVESLFLSLFSSSLASRFVFECFGLVEGKTRCNEEVEVLCTGLERLALKVVCNNGGSFMMTALVKALCPSRFAGGHKTGGKRGRDAEADSQRQQQQQQSSENEPSNNATDDQVTQMSTIPAAVQKMEGPSEWRLFYAVARAFVAGPIPGDTGEDAATLGRRVKLLTQHVVACRAIQSLIPFFSDAIVHVGKTTPQQEAEGLASRETMQFCDDCVNIVGEVAKQSGLLANHSYGNYVLQTVITELAQRAGSGNPICEILHQIFNALCETIFEVSVQKFASNCVETAIAECNILPDGNAIILRFADALLAEGPNRMMEVAIQQYGNYVVRKLLDRLALIAKGTGITTAGAPGVTEAEVTKARELEKRYFLTLTSQFNQLRKTSHGSGLLAWVHYERNRICAAPVAAVTTGGGG